MLQVMKAIWGRWKGLAHSIIRAQNWIVMAVAYVIGMGPVAVIMRLKNADLIDRGLGDIEADSHWIKRNDDPQDIRRSQRPW